MIFKLYDSLLHSIEFNISFLKSYRRYKGGTWYKVFPKPFPYMNYWTSNKLNNECIIETEIYGGD